MLREVVVVVFWMFVKEIIQNQAQNNYLLKPSYLCYLWLKTKISADFKLRNKLLCTDWYVFIENFLGSY